MTVATASDRAAREGRAEPSACAPDAWLDRYGDYLYRYALGRLGNPTEAEDVVQETLLAALKARRAFDGRSSERTWLVGILRHKIVDYYRRKRRESRVQSREDGPVPETQCFDGAGAWKFRPPDWQINPRAALEQREFLDLLHDRLHALPPRQASVFVLREIEQLSADEICKELDISPNNLWVMLHRARLRLRELLDADAHSRN